MDEHIKGSDVLKAQKAFEEAYDAGIAAILKRFQDKARPVGEAWARAAKKIYDIPREYREVTHG